MDDIDIGVDSKGAAKSALKNLDLALQTRQIRLNSGKTRILTDIEAIRHFKIRENSFLDAFGDHIETKIRASTPLDRERKFLGYAIEYGFRTQSFSQGNGEKILKRLISLSRRVELRMNPRAFSEIMLNWPSVREIALIWWRNSKKPSTMLSTIAEIMSSGEVVDHNAIILIANAIVDARLPRTKYVYDQLGKICKNLDRNDIWGFYAMMWIYSKYGSSNTIIALIEKTVPLWSTHENLSRLVAGTYSRFIDRPQFTKFKNILLKVGSRWALDVFEFHEELHTTSYRVKSVEKFILALNPTMPNKITHAKFMMALSIRKNALVPASLIKKLSDTHSEAFGDPNYAPLLA
jgi:hypothetical protein